MDKEGAWLDLGGKMRNAFGHSCNTTGKTIADGAKNTDG
jgi:hypothetical protein